MRRCLILPLAMCLAAHAGFAQSPFNGRWATARPDDPLLVTDAQRKQSVRLELEVEGDTASGTLAIGGMGGTFYTFKNGRVNGNKIRFRTTLPESGLTWTVELVDENTATISRDRDLPVFVGNVADLLSATTGQPVPATSNTSNTTATAAVRDGTRGSIRGLVQDPTRALIPGAIVTATNRETGAQFTTTTDASGIYRFPALGSGSYTITASLVGFETTSIENVPIENAEFNQDFILKLLALRPPGNPPPASCSPNAVVWCSVLHRTK